MMNKGGGESPFTIFLKDYRSVGLYKKLFLIFCVFLHILTNEAWNTVVTWSCKFSSFCFRHRGFVEFGKNWEQENYGPFVMLVGLAG